MTDNTPEYTKCPWCKKLRNAYKYDVASNTFVCMYCYSAVNSRPTANSQPIPINNEKTPNSLQLDGKNTNSAQ